MPAGAAVGIAEEYPLAIDATLGEHAFDLANDLVWSIVEWGRQPGPIDIETKLVYDSTKLSRQRAAADD